MLAIENANVTRNFLFSMKSILLLLQTLLIILIIVTREEYIYRGINQTLSTSSTAYTNANIESIISGTLFFVFLVLEFFSVLTGISSKYMKISSFQALLHVWGVLFSILFIIERFHYRYNIRYNLNITSNFYIKLNKLKFSFGKFKVNLNNFIRHKLYKIS